jgi:hypothetical protein
MRVLAKVTRGHGVNGFQPKPGIVSKLTAH